MPVVNLGTDPDFWSFPLLRGRWSLFSGVGMLWEHCESSRIPTMATLTTASLSTEILEATLLTLDQVTTRLTVLALNAARKPEQSYKVRMLLGDLLADIQDCEEQLGTYAALDA